MEQLKDDGLSGGPVGSDRANSNPAERVDTDHLNDFRAQKRLESLPSNIPFNAPDRIHFMPHRFSYALDPQKGYVTGYTYNEQDKPKKSVNIDNVTRNQNGELTAFIVHRPKQSTDISEQQIYADVSERWQREQDQDGKLVWNRYSQSGIQEEKSLTGNIEFKKAGISVKDGSESALIKQVLPKQLLEVDAKPVLEPLPKGVPYQPIDCFLGKGERVSYNLERDPSSNMKSRITGYRSDDKDSPAYVDSVTYNQNGQLTEFTAHRPQPKIEKGQPVKDAQGKSVYTDSSIRWRRGNDQDGNSVWELYNQAGVQIERPLAIKIELVKEGIHVSSINSSDPVEKNDYRHQVQVAWDLLPHSIRLKLDSQKPGEK